jgi:hypothetical protein
VFGGPDFIVHYRNGHRTSCVMAVFEATADDHAGRPDGDELVELRFMSRAEYRGIALARCVPIVLDAIFDARSSY